ncbi:MAG: hypothetical protein ACREEM_01265 [Blastocatellia bacterium]
MKPENEIVFEDAVVETEGATSGSTAPEPDPAALPEPRTELGAKLIALAKEIDEAGIPKLTLDEIEEYLGRKLGGIAEAHGKASQIHPPHSKHQGHLN